MSRVSYLEEYNPSVASVSPGSLTCSSGSTNGNDGCFVVNQTLYLAMVVRPVSGAGIVYQLSSPRGSVLVNQSIRWELPTGQAQEMTDDLRQQAIAIAESLRPLSVQ
jgi:hypothetical protein